MLPPWSNLAALLFAVGLGAVMMWRYYYPRFVIRIRDKDVETWSQIGRPQFRWYGVEVTNAFRRYLWSRGNRSLGDVEASRLLRRVRFAYYAQLAGLGGFLLVIGLAAWLHS